MSMQRCRLGPHYRRLSPAWFCSDGIIRAKVVLRQGECRQCSWRSTSTHSSTGGVSAWCENSQRYISCARIISCCHRGAAVKLNCHSSLVTCQPLYR